MQLLLRHGARHDLASAAGHSVLHVASANRHCAVVESLVEAGAFTDAQNAHGNTPLHSAAATGTVDVVLVSHCARGAACCVGYLGTGYISACTYIGILASALVLAPPSKNKTVLHLAVMVGYVPWKLETELGACSGSVVSGRVPLDLTLITAVHRTERST